MEMSKNDCFVYGLKNKFYKEFAMSRHCFNFEGGGLSEQSLKISNQIKVGEIARYILRPLLESGKVSTDEIERLKDAGYCKIVFGLFIPMLIPYCGKTVSRYYRTPVSIQGKQYLLTNDWYEDENRHNREPLLQWIAKYEDKNPIDL